jgi:hypothetical protein
VADLHTHVNELGRRPHSKSAICLTVLLRRGLTLSGGIPVKKLVVSIFLASSLAFILTTAALSSPSRVVAGGKSSRNGSVCPTTRSVAAIAMPEVSRATVSPTTEGFLRLVGRRHSSGGSGVTPNNFVVVSYPPCPIGHDGWLSFTSGLGSVAVKWTFGTLNQGDVSSTYTGNCQYAQGCLWYAISPSNAQWFLKSAIISGIGVVFDAKGCD